MSKRTCSIEACGAVRRARGWCSKHYQRWKAFGDPMVERKPRAAPERGCFIEACTRVHRSLGLCSPHYTRLRKYGDPLAVAEPKPVRCCGKMGCKETHYAKNLCRDHYRELRRATHGDIVKARQRDYYQRNRKARLEYARKWRVENPDRIKKQNEAWSRSPRGRARSLARSHGREAAYWSAPGTVPTYEDYIRLLRATACAYCAGDITITSMAIDHVVPWSRGGSASIGNLAACCRPCNQSKSDLLLIEWRIATRHLTPVYARR